MDENKKNIILSVIFLLGDIICVCICCSIFSNYVDTTGYALGGAGCILLLFVFSGLLVHFLKGVSIQNHKQNDIEVTQKPVVSETYQKLIDENKNKYDYYNTEEARQRRMDDLLDAQRKAKVKEAREREMRERREYYNTHCPKCGGTNIQAGTRGYTLTTGFLGAGNVRFICMTCGHKWKPINDEIL